MMQAEEQKRRDRVPGRHGAVRAGLRARDEPLLVVGGEEVAAPDIVVEPGVERGDELDRPRQMDAVAGRLVQVDEGATEERVIVEIATVTGPTGRPAVQQLRAVAYARPEELGSRRTPPYLATKMPDLTPADLTRRSPVYSFFILTPLDPASTDGQKTRSPAMPQSEHSTFAGGPTAANRHSTTTRGYGTCKWRDRSASPATHSARQDDRNVTPVSPPGRISSRLNLSPCAEADRAHRH